MSHKKSLYQFGTSFSPFNR